jgi:hypothetical protein
MGALSEVAAMEAGKWKRDRCLQLICSQFAGQHRVNDHALQALPPEALAVILNKGPKMTAVGSA